MPIIIYKYKQMNLLHQKRGSVIEPKKCNIVFLCKMAEWKSQAVIEWQQRENEMVCLMGDSRVSWDLDSLV